MGEGIGGIWGNEGGVFVVLRQKGCGYANFDQIYFQEIQGLILWLKPKMFFDIFSPPAEAGGNSKAIQRQFKRKT